jgi:signal peptidase
VIHRVIDGNAEDGWVVQGDNNDFLDPWEPSGDQILGHAVLHIPQLGKLAGILLSPLTWISLLIVALAIVVWPGKAKDDDEEPDDAPDLPAEAAPAPGAPQADEVLV